MDVTTGALASDVPALRDFYLGGLDGYRIAFNDDFGQPFVPAKQHFRSETVDSQRGGRVGRRQPVLRPMELRLPVAGTASQATLARHIAFHTIQFLQER